MESLLKRIDKQALNWADKQLAKISRADGYGEAGAVDHNNNRGIERHIVECLWALVARNKSSGVQISGTTKVFYHLTKLLCEVGLSEEKATGMFMPVPKHEDAVDSGQAIRTIGEIVMSREEDSHLTLNFPVVDQEHELKDLFEVTPAFSSLRYHYLWAPLCCTVLFDSPLEEQQAVSGSVLRFIDKYATKNESPVHAVLIDSVSNARILTEAEGIDLLKRIKSVVPWAFIVCDDAKDLYPLHHGAELLVSRKMLHALVELGPSVISAQCRSSRMTPMHVLVTTLMQKVAASAINICGREGRLAKRDFSLLEYLIRVTPKDVLLVQNISEENCREDTPLHLALSSRFVDYTKSTPLRVARMVLEACPEAAKIACSQQSLPLQCLSVSCSLVRLLRGYRDMDEIAVQYPELALFFRDLLAATGDAIRTPTFSGTLFLHRICRNPWLPVLKLVCEAYPEGLLVNSPLSGTPLRTYFYSSHDIRSMKGQEKKEHREAIRYILNQCPEAVRIRDLRYGGLTTLHVAASHRELHNTIELLQLIYEHDPTAIKEKTIDGDELPIHLFISRAKVHFDFRVSYTTELFTVLRWFLRLYPESVAIPNSHGMTPYSIYTSARYPDREFVRALLTACPHLGHQQLRNLNFAARRGALYLLHHLRHTPPLPAHTSNTEHRVDNGGNESTNGNTVALGGEEEQGEEEQGGWEEEFDEQDEDEDDVPVAEDRELEGVYYFQITTERAISIWWKLANYADVMIVKEVVSYL